VEIVAIEQDELDVVHHQVGLENALTKYQAK
jgi:hypothetical protein